MSSSTPNVPKIGTSAAQASERLLYAASLSKLRVSVRFIGNGWVEERPVIITVDFIGESKDPPPLFEGIEQMSGQLERMLKNLTFASLDWLVDCVGPITQTGNHEILTIVGETPQLCLVRKGV